MLFVATFSRHSTALEWAGRLLQQEYGRIALRSQDFSFHHTRYYEQSMGPGLKKRLAVFSSLIDESELAAIKRRTGGLELQIARSSEYPEARPVNIDPGYLTLGKLVLASTKDNAHRIYLRDGIFAEVTLRYEAGEFHPWPWTYADYREPEYCSFLKEARAVYATLLREWRLRR